MTKIYKKISFLNGQSKVEFTNDLKKHIDENILELYIFGSFLTEQFNTDSDLDLLAVIDTSLKFHDRYILCLKLNEFLNLKNIEYDLIIYTPQEFEKLYNEGKNSRVGFWQNFVKNNKKIK